MLFLEAYTLVLDNTGRPDKVVAAKAAINSAISLCCLKANFARDLIEVTTTNVTSSLYNGAIDLTAYPRFRKIKYIRPTSLARYLVHRTPEQIINITGTVNTNSYWIAGTNLNWVTTVLTPTFEVGYYIYPDTLSLDAGTHWTLDMLPMAIVDLATARLFRIIGDNASANIFEASAEVLYKAAKNDFEDSAMASAT